MKYLGLTLDTRWRFDAHLVSVINKVDRIAVALDRLMPNIGGLRQHQSANFIVL